MNRKLAKFNNRKLAKVNTNKDGTLWYIESLIKTKFGLPYQSNGNGSCLYSQFVYTMSALTGTDERDIHNQKILDSHGRDGIDPITLMDSFSNKFRSKYIGYSGIDQALTDCKNGQPVVMVISTNNPGWDCYLSTNEDEPGETTDFRDIKPIKDYTKKDMDFISFHALLAIGYDVAGDFVIFRDIRDSYSFKGYTKIKKSLLIKESQAAVYFSFALFE